MTGDHSESQEALNRIDVTVPHSARIWNYWLGGEDNFEIDRVVGDQVAQLDPHVRQTARVSRAYQIRAIGYLAGEAGIRQFLDVGSGLPAADNTHQVAQRIAPESRIVYVDKDPLVLVHSRTLLASTPQGACEYLHADFHDTEGIVSEAAGTLDFGQPIALMFNGCMGHVVDDDEAHSVVHRLVNALPSGSYLALSDGTDDDEDAVRSMELYKNSGAVPYHLRSPAAFAAFFDGLDLIDPGIVAPAAWRPASPLSPDTPAFGGLVGVAHKP
jgi:hypothetical protein